MGLTKYKIGSLVSVVDERNSDGIKRFYGININKEFMPTVANTDGVDARKYKVVRKNRFVYSGMQTGRDETVRISMYMDKEPIIVSPAYVTFEVTAIEIVIPVYFFMLFLSNEKDRLGWFYSDSSIRANLDWDVFCDIEVDLPPIEVQQKYVDIYNAMVENQKAYECGLEDLKIVIDATLDKLKYSEKKFPVSELLEEIDIRNDKEIFTEASGINIDKQFMASVASSEDLKKYKIVNKNQFVYSSMQTGRDQCIRIALLKEETPIIVSPAYSVLKVKTNDVMEEYIQMWFSRKEVDRLGWFLSDASIRANLDLERFYEIQIPIPIMHKQKALVDIYNVYMARRNINEKIKSKIKKICPILIKGSLQ